MIAQLNEAEEVMAALDQAATSYSEIGRECRKAYLAIEKVRDNEAAAWNGDLYPGEQAIYRCSCADKPYHTDADDPCDVWSTQKVCELHEQQAIEDADKFNSERAEYFRAKQRGEDV